MQLKITTSSGIEGVTKRELQKMGYDTKALNGRFDIEGGLFDIARLNVWGRTFERVYLVLKTFQASTFDELFENVKAIDFENYIRATDKIVIKAKSVKSQLFALSSISPITKKAIIERLKTKLKTDITESGIEVKVEISIFEDKATLSIDTSGEPLHKRGYRSLSYTAPLKETLASAIVDLSIYNNNKTMIDPFCGSGTIPIETAIKALNIAPGKNRNFACENHLYFDKSLILAERERANDIWLKDEKISIQGYDLDENAISLSKYHAKQLGIEDKIHFQVRDVKDLKSKDSYGVILTNPPYGERLLSYKEVIKLYKTFSRNFLDLNNFSAYILTSFPEFARIFNLPISKERKLYNGNLNCRLYSIMGKKPPKA